jgi:AraC-like DNA-binding protein
VFNLDGMVSRSKQMKLERQQRLNQLNELVIFNKMLGHKINVKDLTSAIGVSESTLKKYFYELGYTPVSDYVKFEEKL